MARKRRTESSFSRLEALQALAGTGGTGSQTPWTGDENASNFKLINVKTVTFNGLINNGNSGAGVVNINWAAGQKQIITLTGNPTLTFTAPPGVCNLILEVVPSTHTVTWPGTVKWGANGTPPTFGTNTSIVSFFYDGTTFFGNYDFYA